MTYNDLKKKVDTHRREISKQKQVIKGIEKEIQDLQGKRLTLEENYKKDLSVKQKVAHDKYVEEKIKSYESRVAQLEQELEQIKSQYEQDKEKLTQESVEDKYTDEKAMTAEIKASLNVLQDKLQQVISPRFTKELCSQLDQQQISIEEQDLESLIDYFNRQSLLVEKMSKKSIKFDFLGFFSEQFLRDNPLEKLQGSLASAPPAEGESEGGTEGTSGLSDATKGKIVMIVFVAILLLIVFYATKYVFPFYLALLIVFFVYNVCSNYPFFSALIAHMAVQDSVKQIDDALKQRVLDDLQQQQESLDNNYNNEINRKTSELENAKTTMNNVLINAENSFKFDESSVRASFDALLKSNDNEETSLVMRQREANKYLEELFKKLKASEEALQAAAGDIQKQYLDFEKVGTATIFEPTFILDVKEAKPVLFKHPQQSALFLYDTYADVVNFIRLIAVQLRIKMNPFNLGISVIDLMYMGTDFLLMQPVTDKNDESIKKLFRVLVTKEQLDERLEEYKDDIQRRVVNIRKAYPNIVEYNNFMMSIESLTESYDFLFYIEPDDSVLNTDSFKQILQNGAPVGIYPHLFIQKDNFYEMGAKARQMLTTVDSIFVLEDGSLAKRAVTFVSEKLIKPER